MGTTRHRKDIYFSKYCTKIERVLILSHSNIAVDEAIKAIWKLMSNKLFQYLVGNYNVFPIIRYGYSRIDFIKDNP